VKYAFLFSILIASCAHHAFESGLAEHTQGRAPTQAPELYKQAVDELELAKYDDSLRDFDRFVQQNPANRYTQAAILNSGRALEGLKDWGDAAKRYRQVVSSTARAPRLQAMALYRLSYVNEALGDDPLVIADLTDLQSRKSDLPQEIAEGEMPARLAAAYARIGNFEKAQKYYEQAEVGIARLRKNETPTWLPRTLFLMGETSRSKLSWNDFETFIRPLARSQVYLVQAAELGQSPWSDKAADELIEIYNDMINTIETAQPAEDVLARRALQQKQWSCIGLVMECLSDLRARMLPENANVPQVRMINDELKAIDKKLAKILEERPAGEGLTPSAIARRKARVIKTEVSSDTLEQAFLKSSREVKPARVPSPAAKSDVSNPVALPQAPQTPVSPSNEAAPIKAAPAPTPTKEDPNL